MDDSIKLLSARIRKMQLSVNGIRSVLKMHHERLDAIEDCRTPCECACDVKELCESIHELYMVAVVLCVLFLGCFALYLGGL